MQPNIAQTLKNDPELRQTNFERHLALTLETAGFDGITHVIWPEAAVPYLIERSPEVAAYLTRAIPPGGLLLTGAVRAEPVEGDVERIYNGLAALDGTGSGRRIIRNELNRPPMPARTGISSAT